MENCNNCSNSSTTSSALTVLLNLYRAVVHFHKNFDGISIRYRGSEIDLRKKKVIASPVSRMASSKHQSEVDLQKKKSHCVSTSQMLVHIAVYMDLYLTLTQPCSACKPIFKVHRCPWPTRLTCCGPLMHYNTKLWPTRLTCCGPPVEKH